MVNFGPRCRRRPAAVVAAGALLAGLFGGAVSAPPAHADPTIYPPSYGSNGLFGVGDQSREGLTASIPPGRYRVDQAPSMPPYQSAPGFWLRCSNVPCNPGHPGHIIASGDAIRDHSTHMEILPTDTAVFLANVTLTFVG